jgi:hypothetical protein
VSLLGNTQALQEVRVRFASETPDELQWGDGAEWVTLPELAKIGGRADVNIEVVDSSAHFQSRNEGRKTAHAHITTRAKQLATTASQPNQVAIAKKITGSPNKHMRNTAPPNTTEATISTALEIRRSSFTPHLLLQSCAR